MALTTSTSLLDTTRKRPLATGCLADSPKACPYARHWAREVMHQWLCPEDQVDRVELVVSDLVANALLHAGAPRRVALAPLVEAALRVVVDDAGPEPGRERTDGDDYGRGLALVMESADEITRIAWRDSSYRFRVFATVPIGAPVL